MKLRLAISAAVAALAVPAIPASAGEGIPGTCYETRISRYTGITRRVYECECLLSAWPEVQGSDIVITYCHVGDPPLDDG
ncbi:MAG TPA: hypothetical protein VHI71_07865 [Actinomycetota bacterium]|nr:hypothetical protein [Actinomycetota bacterium]